MKTWFLLTLLFVFNQGAFAVEFGEDPDFEWSITVVQSGKISKFSNYENSKLSLKDLEVASQSKECRCYFTPSHEEKIFLGSKIKSEKVDIDCTLLGYEISPTSIKCVKSLDGKQSFEKKSMQDLRIAPKSRTSDSISISGLCQVKN